jgi:hypothetical protein
MVKYGEGVSEGDYSIRLEDGPLAGRELHVNQPATWGVFAVTRPDADPTEVDEALAALGPVDSVPPAHLVEEHYYSLDREEGGFAIFKWRHRIERDESTPRANGGS